MLFSASQECIGVSVERASQCLSIGPLTRKDTQLLELGGGNLRLIGLRPASYSKTFRLLLDNQYTIYTCPQMTIMFQQEQRAGSRCGKTFNPCFNADASLLVTMSSSRTLGFYLDQHASSYSSKAGKSNHAYHWCACTMHVCLATH